MANTATIAILEKVRRLRALSQSGNANEAANAAAAAERLIQEHRIAEAELEGESPAADDAPPIHDTIVEGGASAATWRGQLIMHLCKAYSCAVWRSHARDAATGRTGVAWAIIGTPSDVETTKYQYAYLTAEIARLAARHPIRLRGRSEFASFYLGAVRGIADAMAEARDAARAVARSSAGTSAALVRIDAKMDRARAAMPGGLRAGGRRRTRIGNSDAYDAGKASGRSIHSGARLGHGGAKLLGG